MIFLDKQFFQLKGQYILQCSIGFLYIFVVLLLLGTFVERDVLEAIGMGALGSSVFLVLAIPNSLMASTKNVMGGYVVAILMGIIGHYIKFHYPLILNSLPVIFDDALYAAFTFAITMFLMTILDFEHPPAGGLAVALVLEDWNQSVLVVILLSALGLMVLKALLKKHLVNLL